MAWRQGVSKCLRNSSHVVLPGRPDLLALSQGNAPPEILDRSAAANFYSPSTLQPCSNHSNTPATIPFGSGNISNASPVPCDRKHRSTRLRCAPSPSSPAWPCAHHTRFHVPAGLTCAECAASYSPQLQHHRPHHRCSRRTPWCGAPGLVALVDRRYTSHLQSAQPCARISRVPHPSTTLTHAKVPRRRVTRLLVAKDQLELRVG